MNQPMGANPRFYPLLKASSPTLKPVATAIRLIQGQGRKEVVPGRIDLFRS